MQLQRENNTHLQWCINEIKSANLYLKSKVMIDSHNNVLVDQKRSFVLIVPALQQWMVDKTRELYLHLLLSNYYLFSTVCPLCCVLSCIFVCRLLVFVWEALWL